MSEKQNESEETNEDLPVIVEADETSVVSTLDFNKDR